MTNMVDGLGTTKYTYSAAGQLLTEDGPFASDTVTNVYSNRLRTGLGLQQPTGAWTNGFAFDITKRLTNVTSSAGAFGYLYEAGVFTHQPARITLPNTSYITYRYDPFGNTISSSGTLASANVYRFSSKEIHANSGMYYYGFRFYDPNLQRWINRDPIAENGGKNLYAFVRNNPMNKKDPLGLSIGNGPFGGGIGRPIMNFCRAVKDDTCNSAVGANVLAQLKAAGIDGNNDDNGGNAFRHCLAACQSAKTCGEDSAKRFWNGREDGTTASGRQDLDNNAEGFANASQGSCWDACMNSWNNGELQCAGGIECPPPRPHPPSTPPSLPPFPGPSG